MGLIWSSILCNHYPCVLEEHTQNPFGQNKLMSKRKTNVKLQVQRLFVSFAVSAGLVHTDSVSLVISRDGDWMVVL